MTTSPRCYVAEIKAARRNYALQAARSRRDLAIFKAKRAFKLSERVVL